MVFGLGLLFAAQWAQADEPCVDLGKKCSTVAKKGCGYSLYYSWDEPEYTKKRVSTICPYSCNELNPDLSCEQWKYFPEEPPKEVVVDCKDYVSKLATFDNNYCAEQCKETEECTHQNSVADGCYGQWQYGYYEGDGEPSSHVDGWSIGNKFKNNFHYTVMMDKEARASDCQQLCQDEENCGYFSFAKKLPLDSPYNDGTGRTLCLMKSREAVVKASREAVPFSRWPVWQDDAGWNHCNMDLVYACTGKHTSQECKKCVGVPVCAWKSSTHVSGPKTCNGEDQWMVEEDGCNVDTTSYQSEFTEVAKIGVRAPPSIMWFEGSDEDSEGSVEIHAEDQDDDNCPCARPCVGCGCPCKLKATDSDAEALKYKDIPEYLNLLLKENEKEDELAE